MGKNTPPDGCVYGSLPLFFQHFFPFFTYDAQGERVHKTANERTGIHGSIHFAPDQKKATPPRRADFVR